jgi:predicted O-methyltransferase YrrM
LSRLREFRRRLTLGLPTVLGLRPGGFFIPYRHAASLPAPGRRPPVAAIDALFARSRPTFREHLAAIEGFAAALQALGEAPPPAPRWRQDWFPRLDAAAAYAMVRVRRPARIVEIGSGHSTRFLARAVEDARLATEIVAIDPAPRAAIDGLPIRCERTSLQAAGPARAARLESGDVLFIDSSHIMMPGSDVDLALTRLLPALPAGAIVHFHDIFLPDDYPAAWAWRGYNEQSGVAALLLGGARYRPLFASRYVVTRMAEALDGTMVARLPLVEGAYESSLWLEKG